MIKKQLLKSLGFSKEYIEIVDEDDLNSINDIIEPSVECRIETDHVVSLSSFIISDQL